MPLRKWDVALVMGRLTRLRDDVPNEWFKYMKGWRSTIQGLDDPKSCGSYVRNPEQSSKRWPNICIWALEKEMGHIDAQVMSHCDGLFIVNVLKLHLGTY